MDEINDIEYADLPMDWDPNLDLLESFEPNYLKDKTFDINSRIFKRYDGVDLRTIDVRKRVIKELTGANVNAKTKVMLFIQKNCISQADESSKLCAHLPNRGANLYYDIFTD